MTVKIPYQCFINGQFVDAEDGETYATVNPTDGTVSDDGPQAPRSTHVSMSHMTLTHSALTLAIVHYSDFFFLVDCL